MLKGCVTENNTAFTLTRFSSVISSGTVIKRSVSTSITVLTISKVTNVRRADVRSSQLLAEEYYECRTNDFFSKGTMDNAWTDREVHCLIDIWTDEEMHSSGIS